MAYYHAILANVITEIEGILWDVVPRREGSMRFKPRTREEIAEKPLADMAIGGGERLCQFDTTSINQGMTQTGFGYNVAMYEMTLPLQILYPVNQIWNGAVFDDAVQIEQACHVTAMAVAGCHMRIVKSDTVTQTIINDDWQIAEIETVIVLEATP